MRGDPHQEEKRSDGSEGLMAASNLATRLAEAVGTPRVVCAPEELVTYAVDGLSPAVIVKPASAAETVEVVKFAIAEKVKVLPVGSRSKCEIGMAPARYDIALDTTGLQEIAHYDAGDMTLSIDAGMRLRDLEGFLKQHRQFLPLAVPCFESTTAAGVVASGIDSVLRQQYGTARDFLIGAEFVDGKGQLCKSGGRVVKNVTGYDLHKLLIGSLGTLAVITRLNFRTFPMAAVSGGHVAGFRTSTAALEYRAMLEKAGLPLSNLEVMSPEAAKMMRAILRRAEQAVPSEMEESAWWAYSSFEGTEAVVKRIAGELEKFARTAGSRKLQLLDVAADEVVGGMLREAFEWLRWAATGSALYRIAGCGEADATILEMARAADARALHCASLIRSGGIIYFALFADSEAEMIEPLKNVDALAVSLAKNQGGHATLLHAPVEAKIKIAEARRKGGDQILQQRVKCAFDPAGVFVPGRMPGGI
jgi:glycolate dehydrogenase FAD-binding subunit